MDGGVIETVDGLRDLYGAPSERALLKAITRLDSHCRHFIGLSPFLVLGTHGAGGAYCPPRGDAPGFVAVLDDRTPLIPARLGNHLNDYPRNVAEQQNVERIFSVPGGNDTRRPNTHAQTT